VAELVRLLRRHVAGMPVLVVDLDEQHRMARKFGRRVWFRQQVPVGGEVHVYEVRYVGKLERQDADR
jgi:hypothetical protein